MGSDKSLFNTLQTLLAIPWAMVLGNGARDAIAATSNPLVGVITIEGSRWLYLAALSLLFAGMGVAFLNVERAVSETLGGRQPKSAFAVDGWLLVAGVFILLVTMATALQAGTVNVPQMGLGPVIFGVWALLLVSRIRKDLG